MVSAIDVTKSVSYVNLSSYNGNKQISFGAISDEFCKSVKCSEGSITDDEAQFLLSEASNPKNIEGRGFTSTVSKVGDLAIKSPITSSDDKLIVNTNNEKIIKEYAILKEINSISSDIAPKTAGLIKCGNVYHIAEEYIDGIHPYDNKMPESYLKNLIIKLTELDKHGIINCDLQSSNIFFLKDGTSRIIDFGSFSFLSDFGQNVPSDCIPSNLLMLNGKTGFQNFITNNSTSRYAASFFAHSNMDISCDLKNYADNPYLKTKSNISNFEFRNLFTFLRDDYTKNPIETLKNYVKLKGEIYHSQMADFLKKINFEKVDLNILIALNKNNVSIDEAKENLQKAVHYEELAKDVLSNPTEDVLKAEAAKIQFKMFLNPDSWNSSIPHKQGIRHAYFQVVEILRENIAKTTGNTQEYFKETLKGIEERFKLIVLSDEQLNIPDYENLVEKLFKNRNPIENNSSVLQTKKWNKIEKITGFLGVCSLIAGGIYLNKNEFLKNQNMKHRTTDVKSNYQYKNTPSGVFSKFA